MFDISIAELLVVGIAGLLFLGPKELINTLRTLRDLKNNLKTYYNDFILHLSNELNETNDEYVKIIIDDEGNPQKVYDLEKIKPYIIDDLKKDKDHDPK